MLKTWPLTLFCQVSVQNTQSFFPATKSLFVTLTRFELQNNHHQFFKSIKTAPYPAFYWTPIMNQMMMVMSKIRRITIQTLKYWKSSITLQVESSQSSGKKLMRYASCRKKYQMRQKLKWPKKYLASWLKTSWRRWKDKTRERLWWSCCLIMWTEVKQKNWWNGKTKHWQLKITKKSLIILSKKTSMRPRKFWWRHCSIWWTKDGFSTKPCMQISEGVHKM